jgi:hypothetical protein
MYRRLAAAVVGLAAVVASAGVVASPAQADWPPGHIWHQGIIRSWAQGRCLDSNDIGEVYTIWCNSGDYQQWKVIINYGPDGQWPWVNIQNVETGRYLAAATYGWDREEIPVITVPYITNNSNWKLFPAYSGNWTAYRFSLSSQPSHCLDANQPFDATGKRPYVNRVCGSNYQDWKMGY